MTQQINPDQLYSLTLCKEDWQRVLDALRNEAYQFILMSDRAQEKGAVEYAELLLDENSAYNALADYVNFFIPEVE